MKQKGRKALSVLLTLSLLVSLLAVTTVASAATMLPSSGGTLNAGTYELTGDVTLTGSNLTINSGEVTIDLAGHVLTGTGTGSVITVNGGSLTLNDSSTGKTGKITGGNIASGAADAWKLGAGVTVNGGSFIMNGGTITGNVSNDSGAAGGVNVSNGGTFTMNRGSKISDNTGTGLNVTGATATIEAETTISSNEAASGAGVHVTGGGTVTMEGGVISKNKASVDGGGVFINNGTFIMKAGSIEDNTAGVSGGGVNMTTDTEKQESSTFTMSGGSIIRNTADEYGGGVVLPSDSGNCVFKVSSSAFGTPTISNNTVDSTASNVWLGEGMSITNAGLPDDLGTSESVNIGVTPASWPESGSHVTVLTSTTTPNASWVHSDYVDEFEVVVSGNNLVLQRMGGGSTTPGGDEGGSEGGDEGETPDAPADFTRVSLAMMVYEKFMPNGTGTPTTAFDDIDACTDEEQKAINALAAEEILSGSGSGKFSPDDGVTYGQVAMAICRAMGISVASGDTTEDTLTNALTALRGLGVDIDGGIAATDTAKEDVVQGWLDTILTRAEYAVLLAHALLLSAPNESYFDDISACSDEQRACINALAKTGIVSGTDSGTFTPRGSLTCGQAALLLCKAAGISNTENALADLAKIGIEVDSGVSSSNAATTPVVERWMEQVDFSQIAILYPITILGPTGILEASHAIVLDGNGNVWTIQGSDSALYNPKDNPDSAIRDQLAYWVYNGWTFTAEKEGSETETYGPTKVIDEGLRGFLKLKIAEGWTLTMDSKTPGYYDYPSTVLPDSGTGTTGSQTGTATNPDGSTTTTTTRPDGTTTETTKQPNGDTVVVETRPDGSVTTTNTDAAGNKSETVANTDGSSLTTVSNTNGSASTTTVDAAGQVTAQVTLPEAVVSEAAQAGEAVALPMPAVPVTTDRTAAPTVTVALPAGTTARVEVPVENVTVGTVAVIVKADGTEEVVKTSVSTENGVSVTLSDGDTVKIVDNSKAFDDVSDSYWGSDAVAFATSRELFSGTSTTTFEPETAMNRAMIVTVLARFEGVDTSTGENWYDAGAQWAVEKGISDGSNLTGSLTREQLATMLYRYAGEPVVSAGLDGYTDSASVSAYAADAMAWAVEQGLITGMGDGTLAPQGQATRAQVATILMRFIEGLSG